MSSPIERYLLAERAGTEGVWDWNLRTDTLYLSPRFKEFLGLPPGEALHPPSDWLDRVHPEDLDWLNASFEGQMMAGVTLPFQIEHRVRCSPCLDDWRWLVCRGVAVTDEAGEPVRLAGSVSDVTDRKLAEQRLRESEERYALVAAATNDGLWDWNLDTGEVYYSPRWKAMLGLSESEVSATLGEWFGRVHEDDLASLQAAVEMHLSGARENLHQEIRMCRGDGSELWVLARGLAVRGPDGRATRLVGAVTNITARKRAEQQLLHNAFHDAMTGLPNRTLLLDRIGQALDRNKRTGMRHFAVLLIDLDRFKTVNDTQGTLVGDRILKTIAERLQTSHRVGDTLARLSADEFGILLNDTDDVGDALEAAERMARAVAQPIALDDLDLVLTASIGIAVSATGYDRPEDMLRDASLAVYRAKQGGRNRTDVFDGTLRREAMTQMRLEADLRTAVEQNQFRLFYQPIVHLLSGRIAGFEALMRWHHPERGLVSPAEFIPLAEESGLIVPMGRWALREAVRQLAEWQQRHPRPTPLFMSVNVSSRQFHDDDLLGLVRTVLAEHAIPPSSLKLEITESLLMQDPAKCREVMQRIRDLDVRLSIDDFGTGYSSLAYLHKFPADTLKIDRTFVQAISTGESSAAIVQVISTLAAILQMDVVAEGVETEKEREFLRDIVCRYGQGYFFARPAPAEQAEALLVEQAAEAAPTDA